jgi:SAM-dependent methyltransferase
MILRMTWAERVLRRLHLLPTPIADAFGNIVYGRVLTIAVRRGLFEALAGGPLPLREIAALTALSVDSLKLITEAFVVGGFLRRRGELYRLSREGKKWLTKQSPSYLGNLLAYFESLYPRWGAMETTLDLGAPPRPYYDEFTDADWKMYVMGMRDLAKLLIPRVLSRIALNREPRLLLDVGGSHGLYSIECCRRYPGLRAVVMDYAQALRYTAELVKEVGMEDRIVLLEGDFLKVPFLRGSDAVLLFNIIHGLREDANRELISRAVDALAPGGKLFILDQMAQGRGSSQLSRFVTVTVGINLLNEIGGTVYTPDQVIGWCGETPARHVRLGLPGVSMVVATRKS